MTLTLGARVDPLVVRLAKGADFYTTLQNSDGDWSPTAVISLRFGPDPSAPTSTWTATIVDDTATFNVDKVVVDALIASGVKKVALWYVDSPTDLCWFKGSVTFQ